MNEYYFWLTEHEHLMHNVLQHAHLEVPPSVSL